MDDMALADGRRCSSSIVAEIEIVIFGLLIILLRAKFREKLSSSVSDYAIGSNRTTYSLGNLMLDVPGVHS